MLLATLSPINSPKCPDLAASRCAQHLDSQQPCHWEALPFAARVLVRSGCFCDRHLRSPLSKTVAGCKPKILITSRVAVEPHSLEPPKIAGLYIHHLERIDGDRHPHVLVYHGPFFHRTWGVASNLRHLHYSVDVSSFSVLRVQISQNFQEFGVVFEGMNPTWPWQELPSTVASSNSASSSHSTSSRDRGDKFPWVILVV